MGNSWKAILGVVLIFIFGFFSGAACSSIYVNLKVLDLLQHPTAVVSTALERRLTKNIALDDGQRRQIHDYFLANLEQRKQLQKEIQPQVHALNRQTFKQIAALLRPDQAERFHQNLEEFRRRNAKYALNADADHPSSGAINPNSGPASPPATK